MLSLSINFFQLDDDGDSDYEAETESRSDGSSSDDQSSIIPSSVAPKVNNRIILLSDIPLAPNFMSTRTIA